MHVLAKMRAPATVAGIGVAGLLTWGAAQIGRGATGEYWASYGLIAAAGLAMALSQLLGGWTKWGWPRVSLGVFVWGFLPAAVCAGWVLLAGQPEANWFQSHVSTWSDELGIGGVVDDLRRYLGVLAFGLGLVLGLSLDTTGPAAAQPEISAERREPVPEPEPTPEPERERTPVGAGSGTAGPTRWRRSSFC